MLALLMENMRLRLQLAKLSKNLTEEEKDKAAKAAEEYRRKIEKMSPEEMKQELERLKGEEDQ
ncbi:hypothetical protein L0222_32345 [bacterium]|nr:hypothetical protein [bacterium]